MIAERADRHAVLAGVASLGVVLLTAWFAASTWWDTPDLRRIYLSVVAPSTLFAADLLWIAWSGLRWRVWWALLGAPVIAVFAMNVSISAAELIGEML